MEDLANNVVAESPPEPVPKRNAGWFQRGDARINRDGRPKLAWAASADRARRAGRLKLFWMPRLELVHRLTRESLPAIGLPPDFEVVAFRVDAARDAVAVIGQSASFPRIAKGAPVPEFVPEMAPPADHAACDDTLMLLSVPEGQLAYRLGHPRGFFVSNLPLRFEIVGCRVDSGQQRVLLTLRSPWFRLVAKGAPIPEFPPQFQGLMFARTEGGWDRESAVQ
jgi:hypothetical protein